LGVVEEDMLESLKWLIRLQVVEQWLEFGLLGSHFHFRGLFHRDEKNEFAIDYVRKNEELED